MISLPGMLLIGAAGRNVGKTELACAIVRRFSGRTPVTGVKVTVIAKAGGRCPRGGAGCGVCSSLEGAFCLTRETGDPPGKDTSRMLAAGAREVFWLRVLKEHLAAGLDALLSQLGRDTVCVCESNSLRLIVRPSLFLMARDAGTDTFKPTAAAVRKYVDRMVLFDGARLDFGPDDLELVDRRWRLVPRPAAAAPP